MKPVLLPLVERLGRRALVNRGVTTRTLVTPAGKLHAYDAKGKGAAPMMVFFYGIGLVVI